jgi:hypothetical protein
MVFLSQLSKVSVTDRGKLDLQHQAISHTPEPGSHKPCPDMYCLLERTPPSSPQFVPLSVVMNCSSCIGSSAPHDLCSQDTRVRLQERPSTQHSVHRSNYGKGKPKPLASLSEN